MIDWPLEEGETVLWEGMPSGAFTLAPVRGTVRQVALVLGGCGVLMSVLFVAIDPVMMGPGLLGTAIFVGLIVGLIGLFNQRRRKREAYGVTDRRALVANLSAPGYGKAFVPYDPGTIEIRPGPKPSVLVGRGPLIFRGEAGGEMLTHHDYVLEMIDDAERVADLLRAAAERNAPLRPDPIKGVLFSASATNWRLDQT